MIIKKSLAILTLLTITLVQAGPAFAASPTIASDSADMKTIEKIKEMVADKVSKLNIIEKRGFIGTVQDTTNTQITVQDMHGKKRFIDIDELTKFQESIGSTKTFGISDIATGDRLAFVGQYNTDTERLLARFVTQTNSIPQYINGMVTEVDDEEFTITIKSDKDKNYTIDIERSTTTKSYDPEDGMQKSGFSQVLVGEKVLAVGFPDDEEDNRISATRVLHFIETEAVSTTTPTNE